MTLGHLQCSSRPAEGRTTETFPDRKKSGKIFGKYEVNNFDQNEMKLILYPALKPLARIHFTKEKNMSMG